MKAAFIDRPGASGEIRYGELPDPEPGESQVLVRTVAVTVNPIDTYIRSGAYPLALPFPFVIGRDMTGVVVRTGAKVTRFRAGDRVWCNNQGYGGRQGTFAELVAVDETLLYHLPPSADPIESVAVLHSGLTAVIGLFARAKIERGERLFVNGGDGNVGTAVLQFAKAAGATVAVTSGHAEKARWCEALGADAVIDYTRTEVASALREMYPGGIDIWWDAAGTIDFDAVLGVVRQRARIVVMAGLTHRAALPVGTFYTRNCTMFGFTVTDAAVAELAAAATLINDALATGSLRGRIHSILPLSRAAEAHRLVEAGGLFGKIVLVPDGDFPVVVAGR